MLFRGNGILNAMHRLRRRALRDMAVLRKYLRALLAFFLQKESVFLRWRIHWLARYNSYQLPLTIALGGILIAAGVFVFSDINNENPFASSDSQQWTQKAGAGISVPACGSSSASAPTCDGALPSVTFDWNLDTAYLIEDIQLIINGPSGAVFNQFICGDGGDGRCNQHIGSWSWTGGGLDNDYSWFLYDHHTISADPLINSGTFRTPVTCPSSNPPPIGYHDSSTCTASFGWACDASDYNQPLQIHFYGDGPAGSGTFLGAATADIAAEAGVASACGGNANHRFQFNTPDSLKNRRDPQNLP